MNRLYNASRILSTSAISSKMTPTPPNTSAFATAGKSAWTAVPLGPPDAILGITEAYKADPFAGKINLGVGAYRDAAGKPYVLECVRKAEERMMASKLDKEYAGIAGIPDFTRASVDLAYGEGNAAVAAKRVAVVQSISGTGALRIGGEFLARFYQSGPKTIYIPTPTWGNHGPIFKDSGLSIGSYRYFDKKTNGLDFGGMTEDLKAAPNGSIILLHACAHNPTGVDPKPEQWQALADLIKSKEHYVFFDMAYQGFASGDPSKDALALRLFVEQGLNPMVAQSYAKNFGLYGERVGALSVVCQNGEERERVESQLKIIIRPMYSNPPIHGARIVSTVLNDQGLKGLWLGEVKMMADRIISMRTALKNELISLGSKHSWEHITDQIGMFCYTGLQPAQVERITKEYHVYLTKDGRISIAGINPTNVNELAKAIHEVTK